MISRLFSAPREIKDSSCFNNKIETIKIVSLINQLQQKADELKKLSDKYGVDSLEFKKHSIIVSFLNQYEKIVAVYNTREKHDDKNHETESLFIVLKQLYFAFEEIFKLTQDTLKTFRNKNQERVVLGVSSAYWGSVATAFVFAPLPMSTGYLLATQVLAGTVEIDPDARYPKSFFIIKKLIETLNLSIENLNFALNLDKLNHVPIQYISKQDNMICPITNELMINPVVCSLDGFSYENSAITKWLTSHKTSPMTRKTMLPEQKLSDVLVPNTNLRQLIEDYKQYLKLHPSKEESELEVKPNVIPM